MENKLRVHYKDQSVNPVNRNRYWLCESHATHVYTVETLHKPCGLRSGSAVDRLLGLWVPIPPGAWVSVSCGCCVLSGGGLCDVPITRPEESYRLWCV